MSGMCDRLRKSAIWRKGELARSLSTNTPHGASVVRLLEGRITCDYKNQPAVFV